MVINTSKILTGFILLCVSSITMAEFNSNFQVKTGNFTLKYEDQTIQTPVNFNPDSTSFFAIEFEEKREAKNGTWVTEYINFQNDYAAGAENITTHLIFINRRQYIGKFKRVQPFIGAGIGVGIMDSKLFEKDEVMFVFGSHYQITAGFKFQFENVNALIEYKKIIDVGLHNLSAKEKGPVISGEGLFFGLGISF